MNGMRTRATSRLREVGPDEVSRVVYSSGTTGMPKAIALTRKAVAERVATYAICLSRPAWERIVCVPGLSTNYGYSFAITTLWLGRTICFPNQRFTREMIVSYQADALVASTHQISAMAQAQENSPLKLDTLKVVHIGGSIAYPPLLARIRLLICDNVLCGYGSTEGGTVAYAPVEYVHGTAGAVRRGDTVGRGGHDRRGGQVARRRGGRIANQGARPGSAPAARRGGPLRDGARRLVPSGRRRHGGLHRPAVRHRPRQRNHQSRRREGSARFHRTEGARTAVDRRRRGCRRVERRRHRADLARGRARSAACFRRECDLGFLRRHRPAIHARQDHRSDGDSRNRLGKVARETLREHLRAITN